MNDILDEVTLGLCFEMHRSSKLGTLFLDEMDDESQKKYESVCVRGLDVFGQVPSIKKLSDCQCPNCHRNLAASRFAPHLEKCMGMGGNVIRVARRSRMPAVSKRSNFQEIETDDNSSDNDWTGGGNKKAKKLKKSVQQKKSPRKMKSPTTEMPLLSSPSSSHSSVYDGKPIDKKKILRNQMCGVISEHTKKVCTRSIKCPQHTDEQRQQVRTMLYQHSTLDDKYAGKQSEDVKGMMTPPSRPFSTLDVMSHPSPADSCSTATSSSSRTKTKSWGKKPKKKKKKSASSSSPRLKSRHNIAKYAFDSSSSSSIMS